MLRVLRFRPTASPIARTCSRLSSNTTNNNNGSRRAFDELTAGADAEQLEFMKEMVIQVDARDRVIGPISKKDSHLHDGVLHRAFSVFVFNAQNELLIQQRAAEKITFPGYWANTCCSHPLFVESELEANVGVKRAAIRKLEHELGIPSTQFDVDDLTYVSTVLYKAASCPNWTEYEMDHILLARARSDVVLDVNANEVAAIEFVRQDELAAVLSDPTRALSPWFRLIAAELLPLWWDNLDAMLATGDAATSIHDYRSSNDIRAS